MKAAFVIFDGMTDADMALNFGKPPPIPAVDDEDAWTKLLSGPSILN